MTPERKRSATRVLARAVPAAMLVCGLWPLAIAQHTGTAPNTAVGSEGGRAAWALDNDMWGHPASDRNYTMGLAYSRSREGPPSEALVAPLFKALVWTNQLLRIDRTEPDAHTPTSWILASSNFTPKNITTPEPIHSDRPYASLLYLGAGSRVRVADEITETQLQLGILGTSIGRVGQTAIHRVCCRDRLPQGWDNQIGDGGAPTFLYHVRQLRPLVEDRDALFGKYSALLSYGAEAGYYARALAGASLYYGLTSADLQRIYIAAVASESQSDLKAEAFRAASEDKGRGFSLWLDYELSGFAYNQLLQGAWFGHNNVRFASSEIEHVVQRINAGVELTFLFRAVGLGRSSDARLYLTQSWKTRDIKASNESKHYWGGFMLSYPLK